MALTLDQICDKLSPEKAHSNIFYCEAMVNKTHANWQKLIQKLEEARDKDKRVFILVGEDTEHYTSAAQEKVLNWAHPENN